MTTQITMTTILHRSAPISVVRIVKATPPALPATLLQRFVVDGVTVLAYSHAGAVRLVRGV